MKTEKLKLFYGGLFHGIGKVRQRATGERGKSALVGADWFEMYSDDMDISQQIRYRMGDHQVDLDESHLAYITYLAANIASGKDWGYSQEEACKQDENRYANQEDIFNVFGQAGSKRYFRPKELNVKEPPNDADVSQKEFSKEDYVCLVKRIDDALSLMTFNEEYVNSALNLAEATLSFVPASTNTTEITDISLYEHSKLTAGFACAIYDYLSESNRKNYKKELSIQAQDFYNETAFLLASFDISGIQDFIYNIATKGAAKQLKARSLFLDFMSEHISDSLLEELDLTRANLIYLGGGHAYFILANTEKTKKIVAEFEKKFNQFLLEKFQTRLYVAFGWSEFAAKDVVSNTSSLESYRQIYQQTSHQISRKKISRYDWHTIADLNQGGKKAGRECQICHSVDQLIEVDSQILCHLCDGLRVFSKQIRKRHFLISSTKDGLPIGPNASLSAIDEEQIKSGIQGRIYIKNDFSSVSTVSTHIFIGDYQYEDIDRYAYLSTQYRQADGNLTGIKRLAVVRLDVDDLGAGFMAGFSQQDGGKYNTFSRSATFSRSMSQFFKVYINYFAQEKKISIIYSGGDDVFAIGTWQDILLFTIELRQHFVKWTNHKLTLSAGIGLFPNKTPVSVMARLAGNLEEAAKGNQSHIKDSIAVFDEQFVFSFDDFISGVYKGKLPVIRDYFNQQGERGKAFAYRLLELVQSKDKMDIARLAYYLSRMEDLLPEGQRPMFQKFKQDFFAWACGSDAVRKQTALALMLYIYESRKEH